MKSICLTICYFGQWPPWIEFFLQSCAHNPTIHWHIITDCGIPEYTPENVMFTQMTLKDLSELVSEKLQLHINLTHPYQLCDLKAAYHVIFDDMTQPYDFFGYTDIDLIYGNIRKFITEQMLADYDVITSRAEAMAGHFTLYRNAENSTRLYELSPHYKKIFQDDAHYSFTELYEYRTRLSGQNKTSSATGASPRQGEQEDGSFQEMSKRLFFWIEELFSPSGFSNMQRRIRKKIANLGSGKTSAPENEIVNYFEHPEPTLRDMTQIVSTLAKQGTLRVYHQAMDRSKTWYRHQGIKEWKIFWDSGTVRDMDDHTELLYFHFLASRRTKEFVVPKFDPNISQFIITKQGISLP